LSDFEARNISRGPFTVAELEEVVAKGHGIVLDSADVPAILRAVKIVSAIEKEAERLQKRRLQWADKIAYADPSTTPKDVLDNLHRTFDKFTYERNDLLRWIGKGDPVE
jgi:hypothetical protein